MKRYPEVQLATLVEKPPPGPGWVHEIKFDGYRLLGFVAGGAVRLITRNGNDWPGKFPAITGTAAPVARTRLREPGRLRPSDPSPEPSAQSASPYRSSRSMPRVGVSENLSTDGDCTRRRRLQIFVAMQRIEGQPVPSLRLAPSGIVKAQHSSSPQAPPSEPRSSRDPSAHRPCHP